MRHDWIPREDTLEHTKENSADISSSSSHLLHCEDSTYNMAALTSISGLQWKGGWIFSLLGCIPNKIQASARNLNSAGMALRIYKANQSLWQSLEMWTAVYYSCCTRWSKCRLSWSSPPVIRATAWEENSLTFTLIDYGLRLMRVSFGINGLFPI